MIFSALRRLAIFDCDPGDFGDYAFNELIVNLIIRSA